MLLVSVLCTTALTAPGWQGLASAVAPPRSGHTAVESGEAVYLFGGYAEYGGSTPRDVVNDLWCYTSKSGWKCLQSDSSRADDSRPGPRLASASAIIDDELLVFGGWDPQTAGTGGIILDDVWSLDLKTLAWSQCAAPMPRGPSSRHVAANVGGRVIVHTFRCLDSVLLWDPASRTLVEQPTSGTPPSSRGLHVGAAADDHTFVVFGGAAKDGNMANDAFALDTRSWTWRVLDIASSPVPSPRAGSCAARADGGIAIFGGAEAKPEGGLNPRADAWLLDVEQETWTCILDDGAKGAPPARNAASMSPLGNRQYLIHGGWHPFVETFDDTHVLEI